MSSQLPWLGEPWRHVLKALTGGRLPAGLLIVGRPGVGREILARTIAGARLCLSPGATHEACGRCAACRQVAAGTHPDFIRVRPPEPGAAIRVDQVRELSRALALTAGATGARCAVVSPADSLTTAAANSLLKTLEEPPPGATLILLATGARVLPPTVVSRCLRLAVPTPGTAAALGWLAGRAPRSDWPMLLALAGGAPLAAERLAADEEHDAPSVAAELLAAAAGRADPLAVAARSRGWAPGRLATVIAWLAHGLLRSRALGGTTPGEGWPPGLEALAPAADPRRLARLDREAIRLAADDGAFNADLARERLILGFLDAFPAGSSMTGPAAASGAVRARGARLVDPGGRE